MTYKRPIELCRALESIIAQDFRPIEVVVINNGEDDIEEQVLSYENDSVSIKFIELAENTGVSHARNLGIAQARGDITILIDDDAECADRNTVKEILSVFNEHPDCAAVACRSIDFKGIPLVDENPRQSQKDAFLVGVNEVTQFVGVMAALRKNTFTSVGGFPDNYFYGAEEFDLSLRLIDAGYTIFYQPKARVVHHLSQNGREVSSQGSLRFLNVSANRSITALYRFPFPFSITAPIYWFCYAVWKSRFDPSVGYQFLCRLAGAIKEISHQRNRISRDTQNYRSVHGENLWY